MCAGVLVKLGFFLLNIHFFCGMPKLDHLCDHCIIPS